MFEIFLGQLSTRNLIYQKGFLQLISDLFTLLHLENEKHVTLLTLQAQVDLTHFTQLHPPKKSSGYFFRYFCGTKALRNQIRKDLFEEPCL
jgi:hypothetical protein